MRSAVLIPVKRFTAAKGRLADMVTEADRARLAEWTATGVVRAVTGIDTFVACDDEAVRSWATGHGASVIWGPGLGLNGAIDDGVRHLAELGFDHVTVSHADLPRPDSLRSVMRANTITLVPDSRRDGTNVLSFPVAAAVPASYGARSFGRHLELAQMLAAELQDIGLEIRADPALALDIDTPSDLNHPLINEVLPSWLRTNLANHP